ncbi:MAG: O-antigen ligase family protein [Pseudomonadales bacterium]|nr:O-antigen ligase family protein [Pseudomonadales bacterium]
MTTSSRFLFFSFLAVLVFVPLPFGSNRPMYWWMSELALHSITILLILQSIIATLTKYPPVSRIHLALFSLLLLFITWQWHSGLSIDTDRTQSQLLKTISLIEVFYLTLVLVRTKENLKLLAMTLVVAGTFQAVYGSLMTITGTNYIWHVPKEEYKGVATGTFINRNHLAGYLEMCLALGIGLLIAGLEENKHRTWRQFFRSVVNTLLGEKVRVRIFLALMVIGLILSQSRMGNTAFFASMMISGLVGLVLFRKSSRGVVILFSSLLIIDIFLMGTFFGIDKVQQRLEQTSLETEERLLVNELSLEIIKDNLWTGTGLGTYYTAFPEYRNGEVRMSYIHAQSDLIEFPSELGILGTLPLAALVIYSFISAIRLQMSRRSRLMRAMGFSSAMAIIAIMLHSLTDFNLQLFATAATFMVILALPFCCMNIEPKRRHRSHPHQE